MRLEKAPPVLVPAQPHALNLGGLERVHGDGPHKRDVHAQPAVDARARQADEDAELGRRPLRRGRAAVAADVVFGFGLDRDELCGGGGVRWLARRIRKQKGGWEGGEEYL